MHSLKKISIVLPTRNRSDLLKKTLDSLLLQDLPVDTYEVIICDNESIDDTSNVCKQFSSLTDNFKYIKTKKLGLHVGRHCGLKWAQGEILVFIDDDIVAPPIWLRSILETFEKYPDIVLVGGKNLPMYEVTPPFWIEQMWNRNDASGNRIFGDLSLIDLGNDEKEISPFYIFGCNFSIRKQTLIDAGGFHPDGMPFDLIRFRGDGESHVSQYIQSANLKAYYHPDASVYHWVSKDRMTFDYFYRRRYVQGISDAYTDLRRNKNVEGKVKPSFFKRLKYHLTVVFGYAHIRELKKLTDLASETEFMKEYKNSYYRGYKYLLNCYNSDIQIKNWVHKENYLDDYE